MRRLEKIKKSRKKGHINDLSRTCKQIKGSRQLCPFVRPKHLKEGLRS